MSVSKWLLKTKGGKRILGLGTGFLNGLFGAGGGSVLVPVLTGGGSSQQRAQATALSVTLPLSAFGFGGYALRQGLHPAVLPLAAGAAAGGLLGAWLLGKLPALWLRRLFALLTVAAGLRMLF